MKKLLFMLLILVLTLSIMACTKQEVPSETPAEILPEDTPQVLPEDTPEVSAYDRISTFLEEESIIAFSPYYELLEFKISNYDEKISDDNIEATFYYTIVAKNYDRDPDTVGYIIEAKESGNANYQQLYDEYLMPHDMNFDFKVVIDKDDNLTLYSNVSPKGVEWVETSMTDYILSD
ncbi:MAG: hypothetical protein RBT15_06770 [Gudongella sp.]|jgi:hypothetical protein|nr:hypothetical protein [Gudongella sp.]